MNSIESNFVPYQIALDMKSIGFDESCFGWYQDNTLRLDINANQSIKFHEHLGRFKGCIIAPLYQQCFRWFREKYKLHHQVTQYYGEHFYYKIEDMVHPRRYEEYPIEKLRNFGEYTSQEEAELECLVKLIEIVKNQTKN